ncbi:MAG: alpha/beta hydrolase-fold protein [Mycobacteriaceae bacterium]
MTIPSASVVAFAVGRMSITSMGFRSAFVLVAVVTVAATVRLVWRHRWLAACGLALLSLAVGAANVGIGINAHYAYYPNVESLWGGYRGADEANWTAALAARHQARSRMTAALGAAIPRLVTVGAAVPTVTPATTTTRVTPKPSPPAAHGLLVTVPIPGVVSGFQGRPAEIYLPPAWTADPSVRLPVLVLLHGTPGAPVDWARSAGVDQISDSWALRHQGVAPILVMPDINGSFWGDSDCTDGVAGHVDTYVATDVANWVAGHLRPSLDHRQWGVGGLSEGGTCAVSLALRHPTVFKTFLDYSGEDHVSHQGGALSLFPGTVAQRRLQLSAYDPYALANRTVDPQQISGWFEVGAHDHHTARQMRQLATVMAGRGFPVQFQVRPGSHNFHFWGASFADSYEWMATRLGTGQAPEVPVGGVPAGRSLSSKSMPASSSPSVGRPRHAAVAVAARPPRRTH